MNCSFRICFLIAVSGWISWNLLYLYIFSFISSFSEACNNFLIRITLLISASSVSVKHRVVYRTLQLAVSPRSAHSSNLWRKRVRQERALLSALLLGKELSGEQLLLGIYYPSLHIAGIPFSNAKRNCEKVIMQKTHWQERWKIFFGKVYFDFLFVKLKSDIKKLKITENEVNNRKSGYNYIITRNQLVRSSN